MIAIEGIAFQGDIIMKLLLAACIAAISMPAIAADLPVMVTKGPPQIINYDSGWYIGLDAGAAVAKSSAGGNLFANALVNGNLTAAGGTIGGCIGHVRGNAQRWFGFHACGDYQNITASTSVPGAPVSVASRWSATQEVRIGGDAFIGWITGVFSNLGVTGVTFPTFTPPSINGGANIAASPRTYFAFGVNEFGIKGEFGGASGATVGIAPMVKAGAIWQTLNAAGIPNGGAIGTYAQVTFATKGITMDNVFAANGAPIVNGASANMGTIYKAGIEYNFAVSGLMR